MWRCHSARAEVAAKASAEESCSGYSGPKLLHLMTRSFIEQPTGSNSIEQIVIRSELAYGNKILHKFRRNKNIIKRQMTGKGVALVAVMGSKELSPTTIDEGKE